MMKDAVERIEIKYGGRVEHTEFTDEELVDDQDIIYANYRNLYQHSSGLVRRLKEVKDELEVLRRHPEHYAARMAAVEGMQSGLEMLNDDINGQIKAFDERLLAIGFKRERINEIVIAVTWDY